MDKYALIVGVDYTKKNNADQLATLNCAVRQAREIQGLFNEFGQLPIEKIRLLSNPTREEFENGLDWLYNSCKKKNSLTVFYYIGHGVLDRQRLMLCTSQDPYPNGRIDVTNLVDIQGVLQHYLLSQSYPKASSNPPIRALSNLVFLDCCNSGSLELDLNREEHKNADFCIFSSTEKEKPAKSNFLLDNQQESGMLFSSLLIEGISKGLVRHNNEGEVTLLDLDFYLFNETAKHSEKNQRAFANFVNLDMQKLTLFYTNLTTETHKTSIASFTRYLKEHILYDYPHSYRESSAQLEEIIDLFVKDLNISAAKADEIVKREFMDRQNYEKVYWLSKDSNQAKGWGNAVAHFFDTQYYAGKNTVSMKYIKENIDQIYEVHQEYSDSRNSFNQIYREDFFSKYFNNILNQNNQNKVEQLEKLRVDLIRSWYNDHNGRYIIYYHVEEVSKRTIQLYEYAQKVDREKHTLAMFHTGFDFKGDEKNWLETFLREKRGLFPIKIDGGEEKPLTPQPPKNPPKDKKLFEIDKNWARILLALSVVAVIAVILYLTSSKSENQGKIENSNSVQLPQSPKIDCNDETFKNLSNKGNFRCADINSLSRLSLRNKKIGKDELGRYLDILQKLPKLEDLDLSFNPINAELSDISKISSLRLKKLNLSDSGIMSLRKFDVGDISNHLEELRLEKNQISTLSEIKSFSNLVKLSISSNPLSTDSVDKDIYSVIDTLKNLQELEADSVGIKDLKLDKIEDSQVQSLKRLYIPNNNVKSLSGIDKFKSLIEIDIRENLISGNNNEISLLFSLPNLETLLMSNNPIKNFTFTAKCENPKQLRVLDLTNISINSDHINNLVSTQCFQNLKSLTLDGNKITNIGEIKNLKNLEYLKISSNSISNLEDIQSLKNLRQLILFNNEIQQISDISKLENLIVLNLKGNYLCQNTENLNKYLFAPKIKKLYIGQNPKKLVARDESLSENQDCKTLNKSICPFGSQSETCIFD